MLLCIDRKGVDAESRVGVDSYLLWELKFKSLAVVPMPRFERGAHAPESALALFC